MKRKLNYGSAKKRTVKAEDQKERENIEKPAAKVNSLDDDDQGFGGWLKSQDGLDNMKLFVVANSIVMLTTLVYPHVQTAFSIVYDMVYGEDALYSY